LWHMGHCVLCLSEAASGLARFAVDVGHTLLNPDTVGWACARAGNRVGVDDRGRTVAPAARGEQRTHAAQWIAVGWNCVGSVRNRHFIYAGSSEHHGWWDAGSVQLGDFRLWYGDRRL